MCQSTAKGALKTSLDKREVSATSYEPNASKSQEHHNRKRACAVRNYRIQGLTIAKHVQSYLETEGGNLNADKARMIDRYVGNLRGCSSNSLFRVFPDGDMTYMASQTCKHKLCPVCNSQRKRKIRRVYRTFFDANTDLMEKYDFFHLTLTVPHTENGYKGKEVYSSELLEAFKKLRDLRGWKSKVYAGEYSVEFTKNENGLHIHLHALVLAHKTEFGRNKLYRFILNEWNRITAWEGAKRKEFTQEEKDAIKAGLGKDISDEQKELFVNALHPSGATHVGLESLYIKNDQGKKIYPSYEKNPNGFNAAIMECLKYHFEPFEIFTDKATKTPNVSLIVEMLPLLHKKRLYGRFGAFHGEKGLSFEEKDKAKNKKQKLQDDFEVYINQPIEEILDTYIPDVDLMTDLSQTANDEIIHPATGIAHDWQYLFYTVADIANLLVKGTPVAMGGEGVERLIYKKGCNWSKVIFQGTTPQVMGQFATYMQTEIKETPKKKRAKEWTKARNEKVKAQDVEPKKEYIPYEKIDAENFTVTTGNFWDLI